MCSLTFFSKGTWSPVSPNLFYKQEKLSFLLCVSSHHLPTVATIYIALTKSGEIKCVSCQSSLFLPIFNTNDKTERDGTMKILLTYLEKQYLQLITSDIMALQGFSGMGQWICISQPRNVEILS